MATAATLPGNGASRAKPPPALGCAGRVGVSVVCPIVSARTTARTATGGTTPTPRRPSRWARRQAELEAAGQLRLEDWRPPLRRLPEHAAQTGRFGDAILRLRLDLRWSLVDLAGAAGMSWRRVSALEHGRMPRMSEVRALADALRVEAEDLAGLRAGRTAARSRPRVRPPGPSVPDGAPGSPTWDALPFADDPWACAVVACAAGEGMETEAIAAVTGWSVRSVQRAVESALAKLRPLLANVDA